ncbi:acyltransferase family protein [Corynebacterium caspium]|uniref:acyltransferase family protein n=1 Tax=Corynebacterium caspium TaxID=234828 RepID=UPI000363AF70|nr:acyltransferase family protein [Corynebacterium caspium]WKD58977.1 Acyltransferase family protein [Corynebacterium caspium DSM 44850]
MTSISQRQGAAVPAESSAPSENRKSTFKDRLDWPDVAKGISIVGVVVLHICLVIPGGMDTLWAGFNHILDPFRMPLFFLVSGMFSTKVLQMTGWQLFSRRLWYFIIPYVFWMPIEKFLKYLEWNRNFETPMPKWSEGYGLSYLNGESMYWFLHALVVFNILLWLSRLVPKYWAIPLSFTPLLLLPWNQEFAFIGKLIMYLPIFFLGCYFSKLIKHRSSRSYIAQHPRTLLVAAAAYVFGFGIYAAWYLIAETEIEPIGWPLLGDDITGAELWLVARLVGQILMLPAGVLAMVLIAKLPYISATLQFLGRHTLPIYLAHPIALTLFFYLPLRLDTSLEATQHMGTYMASPNFWIVISLLVSAAGSYFMWSLQRLPIIKWTIKPPAIAKLPVYWHALQRR